MHEPLTHYGPPTHRRSIYRNHRRIGTSAFVLSRRRCADVANALNSGTELTAIHAYEATFKTTCKRSCTVQYLTSLITLKARTSIPDKCKNDDIGRGMGLHTVISRLLLLSPEQLSMVTAQTVHKLCPCSVIKPIRHYLIT